MHLRRRSGAGRLEWEKLRGRLGAGTLASDLGAALTVALVGLPQCLAYALMSGLPPAYGLVTALVPGFVAALLGKSPHVVTGPTNTTGLLILAALGPFLGPTGLLEPSGLGVLATLALLAGAIRVLAAAAGGASLIDFVPESVLAGFTAGAGLLIMVMQLDEALGLANVRGANFAGQLSAVADTASNAGVGWVSVGVALATTLSIVIAKRVSPRFPAALVAVVVATGVSMLLGLNAARGLRVVGDLAVSAPGWPAFAMPVFETAVLRDLLGPATAIAVLGTIELAVSARRGGARPDMRREIVAQGLANLSGAFVGAFPASASLARSALLELGGAQTRLAAAFAALVMLPFLLFGGGVVAAMPLASLAGVLFAVAAGMIDVARLGRMWRAARATRVLLVTTFVATLTLPLEWAILLGVALGLAHHLATTREPRIERLVPLGDRFVPWSASDAEPAPEIVVLEVSGDCHFAASGALSSRLEAMVPLGTRHTVVDLSHAHALRFAALSSLEELEERLRERGCTLRLAGVEPSFAKLLEGTASRLMVEKYRSEPLQSVRESLHSVPDRESDGTAGTPSKGSDTERHSLVRRSREDRVG